jgi:hypothetical protein
MQQTRLGAPVACRAHQGYRHITKMASKVPGVQSFRRGEIARQSIGRALNQWRSDAGKLDSLPSKKANLSHGFPKHPL